MKLRTPRAWYTREGSGFRAGNLVLIPLSWIWAGVTARRIRKTRPVDPGAPVICVGNLTLGGSGKTPVARALAARLQSQGLAPQILLRGHGGAESGPLRVDPARHAAAQVGDEALMLSAEAPVWIARDRVAGARAAVAAGADVILMDDGHQNPSLRKALSLVVVDGETRDDEWPFGDGSVFPAGPLREPLDVGLARADGVILLLPADLPEPDPRLMTILAPKPVILAHLAPDAPPPSGPLVGFAGIAKPWKFERALKAAGGDLVDFAPLPDHATIPESALRFLEDRAAALGARLITTEKDAARLNPSWRAKVAVWGVSVRFRDLGRLDDALSGVLPRL
jgi:tetraacyldisaccharide 4'-kinase